MKDSHNNKVIKYSDSEKSSNITYEKKGHRNIHDSEKNFQNKNQLNLAECENINSKSKEKFKSNNKRIENIKIKKLNWKYIVFPIIGIILVILIIVLPIVLTKKKPLPPEPPKNDTYISKDSDKNEDSENFLDLGPIEMQEQYKINTNPNDLKRIYINQKYYEYIKIEGVLSKNIVDRKTNYDIYIISETESDEKTKLFYNKTYLCSIAIASECISTKDEYCIPKKLVDLNDQDYSHVKTLRNLDEEEDFKNFPLPLCFFNLTDNNVITSISCHKNISENRVNSIVLDLYFFRPPGIKRIDKNMGNITIKTYREGEKEITREINEGICDVENSIGSFCWTDMLTIKDLKGNLVSYDEIAFTNVTTNEDNYYNKNKTTALIDKTEFVVDLDAKKYNETLNILYPKLKDYLKNYVHFSIENFQELYKISKGIKKNSIRKLFSEGLEKPVIVNSEKIFNYSHYSGIEVYIKLQDNAGYNTEAMEASSFLEIDGEKKDLQSVKEYSDIDKAISKLISLSRAGNNLASALYNNIKDRLNNITDLIRIYIPSMNNLVLYRELTDIFDSTFSLNNLEIIPFGIVEESNNLINNLDKLYIGIDQGSLKNNIRVLNDYLYQFIKNSHILINNIANNLKELGKLIKSPKQAISSISTYYMNHTSTSYIKTIMEAKEILMNYYKNETDMIFPIVDDILNKFENITIESIKKQINLINKLNERLVNHNLTIRGVNDEDENYKKIITNLYNSNNYITNIINLFKQKVKNEMNLKDGYFISRYDIESNNETFYKIIEESLEISRNLDNNEYIDKTFDEIMTNFRKEFNINLKFMEEIKEEQFIIEENSHNNGIFKASTQQKISDELKRKGEEIISQINKENNKYLNTIKEKVDKFLENNRPKLSLIMSELGELLSEVKLRILDNSYEKAFNRSLNKVSTNIQQNKDLAYQYFDGLVNIMNDNNSIIELLNTIEVNKQLPSNLNCYYPTHAHCWKYTKFVDLISNKLKSQFYLNKYNIIKAKFDNSILFINNDLHTNILQDYKKRINAIKEVLYSFKNNKMSDKYPLFADLYFINDDIKNLDNFYNNLNKYISDDRFNNYYLPKIKDYKIQKNSEINTIKSYIEDKHKLIGPGGIYNVFRNKDFCTTYIRKKTYTCNNGAVYEYDKDGGIECFDSFYSDNYNKIVLPTFNFDSKFKEEFEIYFNLLSNKINSYNNLINSLKKTINDVEIQILNEKITLNYLNPIEDSINSILSENYFDKLINSSYNYYKNILDLRLENILNETSNKWIDSFNTLEKNVNDNIDNFKNSIIEFGVVASIYNSIISQNLTKYYYDSIIEHERMEFNNSISFFYNCLIQNVTSVYQSISNQIPTNDDGFNNILDLRKKEVKEKFSNIFQIINRSKNKSLNFNQQTYILDVSPTNFFNMDSLLNKINKETTAILSNKANALKKIHNGRETTEYSLACRYYLENSLNGVGIEDFYQSIDENIFVNLQIEKFKDILSNNWIFDQDDFINRLNLSIYNTNNAILSDFLEEKEIYKQLLEKEITDYFSKDSIVERLNEQYNSNIKEIKSNFKNDIKQYIQNILNTIEDHLINEEKRILEKAVSYSKNVNTINNTIKELKDKILNELKRILHTIVNNFTENIKKHVYKERVEFSLNNYLNFSKNYNSCDIYYTLKSSFNIGNIINEIVNDLVIEYKNFTLIQIKLKNEEYINKIENWVNIEEISKLIEDEIQQKYSALLNSLDEVSKDNMGNNDYDLSVEIKSDIISKIDENMQNINNTVSQIKGEEYEDSSSEWNKLDFKRVDIIEDIDNKMFTKFINSKIEEEKNEINTFLREIIKKNFNTLINNLIDLFGNEFFERILKYNENFKITALYQDLKYSLVVSLLYYGNLHALKTNIKSLTQDIKLKLYTLNNLDLIAQEKNKKVLSLLNTNIDSFIDESQRYLINNYKNYLKEDAYIKSKFNNNIIERIDENIKFVSSDLEKDFISLLNEKFKKKFISSYTEVMNKNTNDMIETVTELKGTIRTMIDDLFTLNIEKVLNNTNSQINVTLVSIKEYNNYFNSFKIPDELINFLYTYGDNVIQRTYDGIETFINKETKNLTFTHLEQNTNDYKNYLKSDLFLKKRNEAYSLINENIDIINENIYLYGIEEYTNILNNEINRIESRRLRRLQGTQTEDDTLEEYTEKVADKSIDENFHKLLNISENIILFVKTYENYDKFYEIINRFNRKLKISYKESLQIIDNAYKDDEIYNNLTYILENLNNYSLNYYEEIKNHFDSLKEYIEKSLYEIDDSLNKCANVTYDTFANKYEEISEDDQSIDKAYEQDIDIDEQIKKILLLQIQNLQQMLKFLLLKKMPDLNLK